MVDPDSVWAALKARRDEFKTVRARRTEEFEKNYDRTMWRKCSPYHWQTSVGGRLLDYWPSRRKWQYDGTVYRGSWGELEKFMAERRGT